MRSVRVMDLATPYDRLRDWIDRIAALGDEPHDDDDLRVRKHALAITVLGLIPAAVVWTVIGFVIPMERHADAAVMAALEMQRAVGLLGGFRRREMQIRVGIASGPVTAGVIGEHRYTYDLWGDTVNVASRMESHGVPGQIQVSEATRALVKKPLPWVERVVDVKGKGEMTAYLLDPDAAPDAVKARPLEVAALAERFEPPAVRAPVIGRSDSVGAIL